METSPFIQPEEEITQQKDAHGICSHCGRVPRAYSFDDILLVPRASAVSSRRDVNLETRVSRTVTLKIPILASYMDTVCEAEMAIALARLGGMGILHRWMTIEQQVAQVHKVKRAENSIIENPYTLPPDAPIAVVRKTMEEHGVGGILITDETNVLLGIITTRDIEFEADEGKFARDIMTPQSRLIVAPPTISQSEALRLLHAFKIEKLPLVDSTTHQVRGLISKKDIRKRFANNFAARDKNGHLVVAASIGIREKDFLTRAEQLLRAGVDVIFLAIANGYLEKCVEAVRMLRSSFPESDFIAGDVADYEGAKKLFRAGADGVLVGIGPGSICETRIISGFGVPQFSALLDSAKAAREEGKVILSDGGIKRPGDVVKAIAAGSSGVVIGSILAGTDEAPGAVQTINGTRVKLHRGLASQDAKEKLERIENGDSANQKIQTNKDGDFYYHIEAEGVESAFVPYRGSVRDTLKAFVGGLRSGMSYGGARTVEELWKLGEEGSYREITEAGMRESRPHSLDVHIT